MPYFGTIARQSPPPTRARSRESRTPPHVLAAARTPTTPYPTVCAPHPPPSPSAAARDARPQAPLRRTPHAPTPPPSAPSCAANERFPLLIPVLTAGWKQWSGSWRPGVFSPSGFLLALDDGPD